MREILDYTPNMKWEPSSPKFEPSSIGKEYYRLISLLTNVPCEYAQTDLRVDFIADSVELEDVEKWFSPDQGYSPIIFSNCECSSAK